MIKLAFGSTPRVAAVRLGSTGRTVDPCRNPRVVSGVRDARRKAPLRRLRLTTRAGSLFASRAQQLHGRHLHP